MPDKKADTTTKNLIKMVKASISSIEAGNRDPFDKLIKSIEKTIPVKRGKKMPKIDPFLNKQLKIQRINYTVVGTVEAKADNLYTIEIKSIDYDTNVIKRFMKIGDTLTVSERELEISSKPV